MHPAHSGAPRARALALIAALTLPVLAWAALTGTSFEGADGNLTPDSGTDWGTYLGTGSVKRGNDLPTGQTDDSLSGKEDDQVPGIEFGSIPNNKSDLLRFYARHERAGSNDFLYLGWVRADTLGTANMDFEFNQSSTLTANGVTVVRTPGDMLILFGFSGGGNLTYFWTLQHPETLALAVGCCANFGGLGLQGAKPVTGGGPTVLLLTGEKDDFNLEVFGQKPGIVGQTDSIEGFLKKLGFTNVSRRVVPGAGHSNFAADVWKEFGIE